LATDYVAVAYVNHGRWVARCPRPGCTNAEQAGRCDDGSVGGLEEHRFTCRAAAYSPIMGGHVVYGGCGLQCRVEWPQNRAAIDRMLAARPSPVTRNWHPGEDAGDLLRENLEHGLVPSHELDVVDGRVIVGREFPRELVERAQARMLRGRTA
jgi:hypothetical protein